MKSKQTHDEVHNPKHYDLFPDQQAIDVIQASLTAEEFAGYCKGNALKYRLRAGSKGDALKCISKANWYQRKLWETPCESADDKAWPDESRIDVIGQNGNDGAAYPEYTLEEVVGGAELSDWAKLVAVDDNGEVWEYEDAPELNSHYWCNNSSGRAKRINGVAKPTDFKSCIWEVNGK